MRHPSIRGIVAVLAVAAMSLGLAACGGGGGDVSLGPDGDVAIQVGDQQITNGEIERRATFLARSPTTAGGPLNDLPAKDSKEFKDFRLTAAGQLVDERTFLILARRCGKPCNVTEKSLDAQIKQVVQSPSFQGKTADFQKALADRGITEADFRASLRAQQEERLLTDEVQKKVTYTEAQARAVYAKNISQYKLAAEKRLSHILLASRAAALAVRATLTPANFAAVAKAKSTDPAAKRDGGDLGPVGGIALIPEVAAAAQSLKPGEISQPVQSQFGWHLLIVRDIKARTKTFDEVKKDIITEQLGIAKAAAVQKWRDTVFKKVKDSARYLNSKVAPATATPTATTTATTATPTATTSTAPAATTTTKSTSTSTAPSSTGPATP